MIPGDDQEGIRAAPESFDAEFQLSTRALAETSGAFLLEDATVPVARTRPIIERTSLIIRRPYAVVVCMAFLLIVLAALLAPLLTPYDPLKPDFLHELQHPNRAHFLGTDDLGHDLFSRVLAGTRYSLEVVAVVLILATAIGIVIGALAGYFGGLVDEVLMRVTDVFLAFPGIILALAVSSALGPSLVNVMISVALVAWPGYARLLRGQILRVKNLTYVDAAQSLGMSSFGILRRHVLPNAVGPMIAQVSLDLSATLLAAASLGFLGLGAQPPTPEWGTMLSTGTQYTLSAWWYPTAPGLAIFITALCLNSLGELLGDVISPGGSK